MREANQIEMIWPIAHMRGIPPEKGVTHISSRLARVGISSFAAVSRLFVSFFVFTLPYLKRRPMKITRTSRSYRDW